MFNPLKYILLSSYSFTKRWVNKKRTDHIIKMGKWKIFPLLLILLFSKCTNKKPLTIANNHYMEAKLSFAKEFIKIDLTSHFPKEIKSLTHYFEIADFSPYCINHDGYFYFIDKKSNYQTEYDNITQNSIYNTSYTNNNTIINLINIKRNIFLVEKCNIFYPNTKPIPYFEDYDFGLGSKTIQENVDGDILYSDVYTIPKDLEIFVVDAKPKNLWKVKCDENYHKLLKEWQHGYSKGIAVSEKENLIVFWTMLW